MGSVQAAFDALVDPVFDERPLGATYDGCPVCSRRHRGRRSTCEDQAGILSGEGTEMIVELTAKHEELQALCRQFGVRRLAVFGSAASGEFDPANSDIDFLLELSPPDGMSRLDAYFGLKEALEQLLGHPVELVDPSALENPYFAASVARTRHDLYAAA